MNAECPRSARRCSTPGKPLRIYNKAKASGVRATLLHSRLCYCLTLFPCLHVRDSNIFVPQDKNEMAYGKSLAQSQAQVGPQ